MMGMKLEGILLTAEIKEFPTLQDSSTFTVSMNMMRFMGHKYKCPIFALLEKLYVAFFMESAVPDSDDLVNEETVEIHRHGDGKREACAHTRGVGSDRLVQVFTELGKILNEWQRLLKMSTINPADKPQIVRSGETSLETAGKRKGPRDPHLANNPAATGGFCTANNANQCAFSGTITP
jgi:hypothetical protein